MPFDQSSPAASWLAEARAVAGQVGAVHAPAEEVILLIGESLAQAHSSARHMAALAAGLAARLEEPEFRETLDGLSHSLDIVDHLQTHLQSQEAPLVRLGQDARGVRRALAGLAKIMAHILVLGVNARIEAARMAEKGEDFTVFTHSVCDLALRGRNAVQQALADLQRLEQTVMVASAVRQDFTREYESRLTMVSSRLASSISALHGRARKATAEIEHLPRDIEQVHHRIGLLVADLQIGDITRQRLEHVQEALSDLVRAAEREELDQDRRALLVNAVCDLQARQLVAVEAEFSGRTAAIAGNLASLSSVLAAIGKRAEAIHSGNGSETFLLEVDADIELVARIVDGYAEAGRSVKELLQTAAEAAQSMSGAIAAIADVDADLNILGLNASIKCGRLRSGGQALDVVAQELRVCAGETRNLAASVTRLLSDAEAAAAKLSAHNDLSELAELRDSLHHSVAHLRQLGGETAWVFQDLQRRGVTICAALEEAAQRLDIRHAHATAVRQAAGALERLAGATDPHLPPSDLQAARQEVFALLEGRYTMESERHVHHGRGPEDAAAGQEVDIDDLLF